MTKQRELGRKIVVRSKRKSNGAVGSDRKNNTGKVGVIYDTTNGQAVELARAEGPTFKALSKALRGTGLIPTSVTINKSGETFF